MKRIVCVLLALCLLLGLTACGGSPEPTTEPEPEQEEKTTTTTTAPVADKLTYADIVGGVRRLMAEYLPTLGSVTDEAQNTLEDGSVTRSFKYVDGNLSVTVTLKEGEVSNVIVLCNTSKLPTVDNMNPFMVASILMGIPASVVYSDGDVDKIVNDFFATDPTTQSDLGATYVLEANGWKYVMNLTVLISTLAVAPIEEEEPTTTAPTNDPTEQQPAATKEPTTTRKPATTTEADPCANGHSWEEASCSSPAMCSVCKKTTGSALSHDIDVSKCRNCDHTDFSAIARTYSSVSAYDLVTGEYYDVQDVSISSSGVFSFTFNGETYKLNLVQKNHSYSGGMVEFDCYRNGKKEADAVVEVYASLNSPRLKWRSLQGCDLYIYAE